MIFGVVCILSIVFAISLIFIGIKKNSDELLLEKKNLSSFSEGIKDLQESKKLYEAHQADLEKISKEFVDPKVPVEFIKFLEQNAKNSGLSVDISPIATEEKENEWPSLSFQITTNGSFPSLLKFLEKLENSPYLIEILNLNLMRINELEEGGVSVGGVSALFLIKVSTK